MKKGITINQTLAMALSAFFVGALAVSAADAKKNAATGTAASNATSTTYNVVPEQSQVTWIGKKVTGQHNGTVNIKSGQIKTSGKNVTGGSFVIDMASIKVSDIEDAESNGKLVGHLKSEDFFGTDKNPTATFEVTKVTPATTGTNNYTVEGNLTIKGTTRPASFSATITMEGDTLKATVSEIKIDRTAYNIRYGSKKFFDKIGDKAIHDDFSIGASLLARKG